MKTEKVSIEEFEALPTKKIGIPNDISDVEYAWAAGFIEADGYLTWDNSRKHPYPMIGAVNADLNTLKTLQHIFNGNICECKNTGFNNNIIYRWYVNGKHAQLVAKKILPCMKGHKRELALKMMPGEG